MSGKDTGAAASRMGIDQGFRPELLQKFNKYEKKEEEKKEERIRKLEETKKNLKN